MAYSEKKLLKKLEEPYENRIKKRREFYTLTLVLVPTLMVGITAQYISNVFVRAISLAIMIFFQAVIVKGLIENN